MIKTFHVSLQAETYFFDLANDFTGEATVSLATQPLSLTAEKVFKLNFEKGKANFPNPLNQRSFFQIQLGEDLYIAATRRIPVHSLFNGRDLGGYQTTEGRLTKWGLIYRGDAPDHLTAEDVNYLSEMAFGSVIDLRSPKEIQHNPDIPFAEKKHYNFNPHAEIAKQASETPSKHSNKDQQKVLKLEQMAKTQAGQEQLIAMQQQMVSQMHDLVLTEPAQKAYQDFLQVLLRKEVPLFFHCQGGKDRTGWGAAIILGLLNVPEEVIYQDYFLTEKYNQPRNQGRMDIYRQYTDNAFVLDYLASLQKTKAEYLDSAFTAMKNTYGTMANYAQQALKISAADIKTLQDFYLY
ncbi:protein-tyrosine phosphatase [Enterococcus sp. PF1-24]|uniref:tyrosine-protein phosphatase n=1 Tax=unclassified Enterococcus TaxID=2608891 RepID=UPI002476974F|nr:MULTISPECIES: tyrosine-protein phosphatase [unclassified Enterococcus]MDH6365068.1 protein-tyrosine phosphatase [Enterococcus sp. PFB1-1]MDH6402159.1 protein-tyrosine phosphatase [Enterococcus sp. PF1-24]